MRELTALSLTRPPGAHSFSLSASTARLTRLLLRSNLVASGLVGMAASSLWGVVSFSSGVARCAARGAPPWYGRGACAAARIAADNCHRRPTIRMDHPARRSHARSRA